MKGSDILLAFWTRIFASRGITSLRLARVLLCLMLLMVLVTPLLQLDSLDSFPVTTDDIEMQIIYCLNAVAILLVFSHALKLICAFLRGSVAALFLAVQPRVLFVPDAWRVLFEPPPPMMAPLRI